jgi:hypothetical protein
MNITRISLAALAVALAACDVGTFGMSMGDDDTGGIDPTVCKDRATKSIPTMHPHTTPVVAANPSNAGESCVAAMCHLSSNLGAAAPAYQYAGTLYSDTAGTVPNVGAWIRVQSGDGSQVIEAMTDTGGNFWFEGTNMLTTPFPAHTSAAVCGGTAPPSGVSIMTDQLNIGGGSCNQGGACHGTPMGATAGTYKLFIN